MAQASARQINYINNLRAEWLKFADAEASKDTLAHNAEIIRANMSLYSNERDYIDQIDDYLAAEAEAQRHLMQDDPADMAEASEMIEALKGHPPTALNVPLVAGHPAIGGIVRDLIAKASN